MTAQATLEKAPRKTFSFFSAISALSAVNIEFFLEGGGNER
jgi:hypothetical protein